MSTEGQTLHGEWINEVLTRYEGQLLRYAFRFTGELERARDVVQDTFIRLCREDRAKVEGHLAEWLFTVCRNRALDLYRKESRMSPLNDFQLESCPSNDPSPDDAAELHDTSSEILQLLQKLPKNQQEVVRLKFQNGLSYREISNITHLTVTNVGFLLHTAIRNLRAQLKTRAPLTSETESL